MSVKTVHEFRLSLSVTFTPGMIRLQPLATWSTSF
jgi:hypothetical protein